jgi:hypothetical protein
MVFLYIRERNSPISAERKLLVSWYRETEVQMGSEGEEKIVDESNDTSLQ